MACIEVQKFLAESPSVTTHAIQISEAFNASLTLIIVLHLSLVISYFDVYSSSIAAHENKHIPKNHITAEEPPWNPSTNEHMNIQKERLKC